MNSNPNNPNHRIVELDWLLNKGQSKHVNYGLRFMFSLREHNKKVRDCNEEIKLRQEEEEVKRERRARIAEYEATFIKERTIDHG